MINDSKISFGFRPIKTKAVAFVGARTIFEQGDISFVPGRCSLQGEEKEINRLSTWTIKKALPELRKHIRQHGWKQDTREVFTFRDGQFLMEASPNASYGYLYISTYIMMD